MTLVFESNNVCLIDHSEYISKVFKEVCNDENRATSIMLNRKLFCIKNIKTATRKRKHGHENLSALTLNIKNKYDVLKLEILENVKERLIKLYYNEAETKEIRELSQQLFETTCFNHGCISGGNCFEKPIMCKVQDNCFYIPANSRFYCGCIKEQCLKLVGNKYDIIIADPPWWNRYIRRLKSANDKLSYSMMYNEDIASIPVKKLLSSDCLVAVWCTNAPSCVEAVTNVIFPSWGVEYVTTWYWLKVTTDLEPICNFSSGSKKQPYERLIIGKVGQLKTIPNDRIVMSVPSALHSHKPPLIDLLKPFLNTENPEILELFARYLLPNTTSVGYEPLKWQHESLYELGEIKIKS